MVVCVFSITHILVNCQMCKIGSSLSWYFSSYIHREFARGTTMIGFTFIARVIVDGGGVGKIHVLANSGLWKNNLNKSHTIGLSMPLLVLAFAIGLPLEVATIHFQSPCLKIQKHW